MQWMLFEIKPGIQLRVLTNRTLSPKSQNYILQKDLLSKYKIAIADDRETAPPTGRYNINCNKRVNTHTLTQHNCDFILQRTNVMPVEI
jgi:hypothetical protein